MQSVLVSVANYEFSDGHMAHIWPYQWKSISANLINPFLSSGVYISKELNITIDFLKLFKLDLQGPKEHEEVVFCEHTGNCTEGYCRDRMSTELKGDLRCGLVC